MVIEDVIGFGLILLIVMIVVIAVFGKTKTRQYRKYIADLYVSAKIRFFAKEDELDLVAEEMVFKKWAKKSSNIEKDLDESVEEELKERIADTEMVTKKK